jgi:hypothetical protein
MSDYLNNLLKTGRTILEDTKAPRRIEKKASKKPIGPMDAPTDNDPHKVLIKKTIQEKPKKSVLIDEFKRFIDSAEAI